MSPESLIYGLIGYPVKHSFSALMHNAAFEACGIKAKYELFEVEPESLENFLVSRTDVAGFNITVPYKVKAKDILKRRFGAKNTGRKAKEEEIAELSGAVNTVKRFPSLKFYNTDAAGFLASLKFDLNFRPQGKTVFVLGCGGAGRAVIAGLVLTESDIKIYAYDINKEVQEECALHFSNAGYSKQKCEFIPCSKLAEKIKESQLFVNTTPIGMKEGDGLAIDPDFLHSGLSVYDAIYNRKTELIKKAESLGLPFSGGLGMLLYQGVIAFEIWAEREAPVELMRAKLLEELKK